METQAIIERDVLLSELARQGIHDPRVLAAMARVPRDRFVPPESRPGAWENRALPIAHSQTISQPYIVALMSQALEVARGDRVLEIGTGSGYGAAVLAELGAKVTSIERWPELAIAAQACLERLGYQVEVVIGDGSVGDPAHAPYQGISVTAAGPTIPATLLGQLAEGGRLVMPVGLTAERQRLLQVVRHGDRLLQRDLGAVRFVPLIGEQGFAPS
jgi:protein-L-isoaspartate(D-aspartate) O-methyltransferase